MFLIFNVMNASVFITFIVNYSCSDGYSPCGRGCGGEQ